MDLPHESPCQPLWSVHVEDSKPTGVGITVLLSALFLMGTAPAEAKRSTWHDPLGDTNNAGRLDIGKVVVKNRAKKIVVRFNFPKADDGVLPTGNFTIHIDTKAKRNGPEFAYEEGYPGHPSWGPMKNWRRTSTMNDENWAIMYENAAGEWKDGRCLWTAKPGGRFEQGFFRVAIRKNQRCIGFPKKVRVNIATQVYGETTDMMTQANRTDYSKVEKDFFPAKHKWSKWVRIK